MGARATDMTEALASMVDVAFAVSGDAVPREHRRALAQALEQRLPWLAELTGAGVHRLNVSAGGGPQALLSQRTRLTLRVPRQRAAAAAALEGAELRLGAATLRIGAAQVRELLPWGTLYAHVVAADAHDDELTFLRAVGAELVALGVDCRPICGRLQVLESGALRGYGLMLDRLSAADSLRVLEAGVGAHRRLGCGVFVPHKSAAAVGAPA
jgi:CRISPR-associated protein Cas6